MLVVRPLSMCFAVGPMESGRYLHICSLFGHAASCVFCGGGWDLGFCRHLCGSSFLACTRRHHDDGTSIVQHMDGIKLRQAQHSLEYVRSNSYRFHVATLSTVRR